MSGEAHGIGLTEALYSISGPALRRIQRVCKTHFSGEETSLAKYVTAAPRSGSPFSLEQDRCLLRCANSGKFDEEGTVVTGGATKAIVLAMGDHVAGATLRGQPRST